MILCFLYILVFYASQCEVLMGSMFSPCHGHISPNIYHQQCRYQACRCGSSCLCTALAHYAYLCSRHGVNINFRSQVSECGEHLCSAFVSQPKCFARFKSVTQAGWCVSRGGVSGRHAVPLLCIIMPTVVPSVVWHRDV